MINLFTSYYKGQDVARQSELRYCLMQNIKNELIDRIYLMTSDDKLIENISSDKIIIIKTDNDISQHFSYYFQMVNKHTQPKDINIISNADIFFDSSIGVCHSIGFDDCIALARWEVNRIFMKSSIQSSREDSQDAWIFKGGIRNVGFSDFPIGALGCDNRIAHELKEAGYNIYNPSKTIKCWHLHNHRRRMAAKAIVPPPYLTLPVVEYKAPTKELTEEDYIIDPTLESKIIAITSISPSHLNYSIQKTAIDSWIRLGMSVYSLNSPNEIDELKKEYKNVEFVETHRTMEKTYGKPVISINSMLDFAKNMDGNFCIINSDIELDDNPHILKRIEVKMKNSIVICQRIDYEDEKVNGNFYIHGFDVFFMNKSHLHLFPQSMMAIGQCFWDYWIPYKALNQKADVILMKNRFAYHKIHNVQYSEANWEKAGRYFQIDNDLLQFKNTEIGKMSEHVYESILLRMNHLELL